MKGYFIFETSEDGARYTGPLTAEALQKALSERGGELEFQTSAMKYLDPMDDHEKILVIKGEIVVPQPVKVATSYRIP